MQVEPIKFFKKFITKLKRTGKNLVPKELDYNSGLEVREENPDQLLRDKGKDLTIYTTMMMDDTISSTIELKKKLLLSVPYSIQPASENTLDIEKADFIQENIDNLDIPFDDQLDNFLDSWVYGFKVCEKIYETKDGKWYWKNWKHKHSNYFDFSYDDYGNIKDVIVGKNYGYDIKVTGKKEIDNNFIINVNPYPIDGNYYGKSDLMEIYLQYYQKYHTYRWRGTYLQGFGMPVPIVAYDKTAVSATEYNDFTDMLENWQDTMYVMIPSVRDPKTGELKKKFEIDFRELSSSKQNTPYDAVIDQLDKAIRRKLLLPDKMGFSESSGGSYSLGETQFDLLKMVIRDGHTKLEELINPHIKLLIDLNYPNTEEYPKFIFNELSEKLEVAMLKLLVETKIVSPYEKWIRGRLQLPELTEKEQEMIDEAEQENYEKGIERQKDMLPVENDDSDDKGKEKPIASKDDKEEYKPTFNKAITFKTLKQKSKEIEEVFDFNEKLFIGEYSKLFIKQSANLIKQVTKRKIIENKDIKAIDSLVIKKGLLNDLLTGYYFKMYTYGKLSGINNVKDKINNLKIDMKDTTTIPDDWINRNHIKKILENEGALGTLTPQDVSYLKQLQGQAFFLSGTVETRMVKEVYSAITEGLNAGDTIANIVKRIEVNLSDDLQRYKLTIARTNSSDAFNSGRLNFFTSEQVNPFIEAYQYSAIIDNDTTEFCRAHDEQIIKANDPRVSLINPPNHFNCRSVLIPIMIGENDLKGSEFYKYQDKTSAWGTNVPVANQLPSKGFGGV